VGHFTWPSFCPAKIYFEIWLFTHEPDASVQLEMESGLYSVTVVLRNLTVLRNFSVVVLSSSLSSWFLFLVEGEALELNVLSTFGTVLSRI